MKNMLWAELIAERQRMDELRSSYDELRSSCEKLRSAYGELQERADQLQRDRDGYVRAYETASTESAHRMDRHVRMIGALRKLGQSKQSLPPGLEGRQLCFLHIGKTAGTSVQHALMETFFDASIFHDSLIQFDAVFPEELALYDVVLGHFMFQHVAKLRSSRFLFTFVRDAVDRVVSNYYFLREDSPSSPHSDAAINAARRLSLKEFLLVEDPQIRMITSNFQANAIARDIRPELKTGENLLAEARANLQKFDFVGVADRLPQSMAALSKKLGLARALPTKTMNVTSARKSAPPPTPEEVEIIVSLNAADIALYADAVAMGHFQEG